MPSFTREDVVIQDQLRLLYQARSLADRSTCPAAKVGAVIVEEGRVIAGGVNGAPIGVDSCCDAGCEWYQRGVAGTGRDHARHLHAEVAAIAHAASYGVAVGGRDMVVTRAPCPSCALVIIASGIGRVVVSSLGVPNGWDEVRRSLECAGVEVVIVEEEEAGR